MKPKYRVQPLGNQDRAAFHCGDNDLDNYFRERASRDVREKLSAVFVLVNEESPGSVVGYYTLSSLQVDAGELPEPFRKHTGRYRYVGATLIGRLAVAVEHQGEHLGEILLLDALQKSLDASKTVAAYAVVVDAKTERVAEFYKKYGFIPLRGNRLFISMKTVREVLEHPGR